jgi:hypothetical protein
MMEVHSVCGTMHGRTDGIVFFGNDRKIVPTSMFCRLTLSETISQPHDFERDY